MAAATEAPDGLLSHDWLGACRRAVDGLKAVLVEHPTSRERVSETGTRGEGGDRTLVIDAAAEDAVFAELQRLHDAGARFTAVSEERGTVDFGESGALVVVDPIDGSMNAKRGLPHHALSIAVADGPTMADVVFGYVFDLGPGEEWHAVRGGGAFLDGEALADPPPERSAARRAPGARRRRVGRSALAGRLLRRRSSPSPTASARWARSRSRCARSPPCAWTAWRRCAGAAPSTRPRPSSSSARAAGWWPSRAATRRSPRPWTSSRAHPVVAARTDRALAELATLATL